jgi:hypothetical protein
MFVFLLCCLRHRLVGVIKFSLERISVGSTRRTNDTTTCGSTCFVRTTCGSGWIVGLSLTGPDPPPLTPRASRLAPNTAPLRPQHRAA